MKVHNTTIEVVRGSVTDQDVDAIVNAANTEMRGGGGIDGRIHHAAGPTLLVELKKVAPDGADTGTAVITGGHRMKQRHIIHTPGPIWDGGDQGEPELLAACYRSSLELAIAHQLNSIAFCSISTGIYGYPLEQAAPIAVGTVIEFLRKTEPVTLRRVVFAMYQENEFVEFEKALGAP